MALIQALVSRCTLLASRVALPAMIVCGVGVVLGRHLRLGPATELKEIEGLLFFALAMLSFGYAYLHDAHVRIDLLSRLFPARVRAAIELAGCATVLAPFCAVLLWYGTESAWQSFVQGERLASAGWPLQWLVRLLVPCGALLLLAAAFAVAMRCLRELRA